MNLSHRLLSGSCLLLAACGAGGGRALLVDASGHYRLAAQFLGDEATGSPGVAALRQLGDEALVFALDARAAPRFDGRMVRIDDESAATPAATEGARTAVVMAQTGAAVAVDVALLWCHGITPPRRLAIGTKVKMPGGTTTTQPAPGDFVIALLRREHAELLTTAPTTDTVFRVGCATIRGDGRHLRIRDEARAAAQRYPQLDLVDRSADGDASRLEAIVREFLADGHRAILLSIDAAAPVGSLAAAAQERNVALIVLDPSADCEQATCCIGSDQRTLGRAAGEAVKVLAPGGAAIVEFAAELQSESARQRHQGFCDALALQQKP